MDQVHVIRHKVLVEGRSARQVAREMGVSRNTVKRYLALPAPVRNEQEARKRPVWERVEARLHALLDESPRWTGGKQRLTATRLHQMLVAEGFADERKSSPVPLRWMGGGGPASSRLPSQFIATAVRSTPRPVSLDPGSDRLRRVRARARSLIDVNYSCRLATTIFAGRRQVESSRLGSCRS